MSDELDLGTLAAMMRETRRKIGIAETAVMERHGNARNCIDQAYVMADAFCRYWEKKK